MSRFRQPFPVNFILQTSKAVSTDWFAANIKALNIDWPVRHTIEIRMATTSVVNLLVDHGTSSNIKYILNDGASLTAGRLYVFDFLVYPGMSYNIQHDTTTQLVDGWIVESLIHTYR